MTANESASNGPSGLRPRRQSQEQEARPRPFESTVNRTVLNVLLAALDIDQQDLADVMGYRPSYVVNIFNGFTPASGSFRRAFADALTELLLGEPTQPDLYPAEPLRELLRKRADQAPCKRDFYTDLGLDPHGLGPRQNVSGSLVDRICCALGVHPTALYGDHMGMAS